MSKPHTAAEKAAREIMMLWATPCPDPPAMPTWTLEGIHKIVEAAIDERTKPLVEALQAVDAYLMTVPVRPGICKVTRQIDDALASLKEGGDAK